MAYRSTVDQGELDNFTYQLPTVTRGAMRIDKQVEQVTGAPGGDDRGALLSAGLTTARAAGGGFSTPNFQSSPLTILAPMP